MSIDVSIEHALVQAFEPAFIEIDNESHLHSSGKGVNSHFKITLVSERFVGQSLVGRHRSVQKEIKPFTEGVHAIGLHTYTPEEWSARGASAPDSPSCSGGGR
jgi:BolA protein